jgi:hypothetical protein
MLTRISRDQPAIELGGEGMNRWIVADVGTIVIAGASTIFLALGHVSAGIAAVAIVAGLEVVKSIGRRIQERRKQQEFNRAVCEAALRVVRSQVAFAAKLPADGIRATLLVPDPRDKVLRQYARHSGRVGTSRIAPGKGVAGQCFDATDDEQIYDIVDEGLGFLDYMKTRGFTEEEARKFQECRAYLCCKIRDGDRSSNPIAVLSVDFQQVVVDEDDAKAMMEAVSQAEEVFRVLLNQKGRHGQ